MPPAHQGPRGSGPQRTWCHPPGACRQLWGSGCINRWAPCRFNSCEWAGPAPRRAEGRGQGAGGRVGQASPVVWRQLCSCAYGHALEWSGLVGAQRARVHVPHCGSRSRPHPEGRAEREGLPGVGGEKAREGPHPECWPDCCKGADLIRGDLLRSSG